MTPSGGPQLGKSAGPQRGNPAVVAHGLLTNLEQLREFGSPNQYRLPSWTSSKGVDGHVCDSSSLRTSRYCSRLSPTFHADWRFHRFPTVSSASLRVSNLATVYPRRFPHMEQHPTKQKCEHDPGIGNITRPGSAHRQTEGTISTSDPSNAPDAPMCQMV